MNPLPVATSQKFAAALVKFPSAIPFGNPGHAAGFGVEGLVHVLLTIEGTHFVLRTAPFTAAGEIADEPPLEHAAITADALIKSATYRSFKIISFETLGRVFKVFEGIGHQYI